jgi:hypothetical protein
MCCLTLALSGGGYALELRAGAGLAVWWVVLVGLLFGLIPRDRVPRAALVTGTFLAALAIFATASLIWASDNGRAFAEGVRVSGYLGLFILVVLASRLGTARVWLTGLALGLAAVAAMALGSRFVPSWFPEQDLATVLPSTRTRLSYPLNYWNGLGATMALGSVLLLWLGVAARTRPGRSLATGAAAIPALALFLTSSRGGALALAAGIVVLVAVAAERVKLLAGALLAAVGTGALILLAVQREAFVDGETAASAAGAQGREMLLATALVVVGLAGLRHVLEPLLDRVRVPRRVSVALGGAALVAVVVGIAVADPGQRIDDFKRPPSTEVSARGFVARHLGSTEGNGRYQFWETGIDAFASKPLIGIGAGGFEAWWAENGSLDYYIRDAHSLAVETLAELGILGFLLVVGFFVSAAVAGIARRRALPGVGLATAGGLGVLAAGAVAAAIEWTWEIPAAFAPVVVATAVLTGPALGPSAQSGRSRYGWGVAALVVGWAVVFASGVVLVSEAKVGESRDAAREGDLREAAADARGAQAVQPWAAEPYLQLALVEELRDLSAAERALGEALERSPDDWRLWLVAARLRTKSGDIPGAREALGRAQELNPRSPTLTQPTPG